MNLMILGPVFLPIIPFISLKTIPDFWNYFANSQTRKQALGLIQPTWFSTDANEDLDRVEGPHTQVV